MRDFAATTVAPRRLYAAETFPLDVWRIMGERGLFRAGLPETFGGSDGGYAAIASNETALIEHGGSPGFAMSWAGHQLVARFFLAGFGGAAQQAALLPALAAGRSTASVAISEPGVGAHPKQLTTTARAEGAEYVIVGQKTFVTNGPIADLFIVLAITAVENERKRYSAFLMPRSTAGLEILPMKPLGALRPSPHCSLRLTNCRVPANAMLGAPGTAYETMALPFRDVEDAVATSALAGALRFLSRRLGAATNPSDEAAAALGEIAALVAVLAGSSHTVVAALDAGQAGKGEIPAVLVGIRALAADLLRRVATFREAHATAPDEAIDAVIGDLTVSLGVARGPRLARQARLGSALMPPGP